MDNNYKLNLVSLINNIHNYKAYKQIFKVILKNNVVYSQNNNGILFSINKLSDTVINDIELILKKYIE